MSASMQGLRTFGERPKPFQIEENGEYYYVGSEVRCKDSCNIFSNTFLSGENQYKVEIQR